MGGVNGVPVKRGTHKSKHGCRIVVSKAWSLWFEIMSVETGARECGSKLDCDDVVGQEAWAMLRQLHCRKL